MTGSKYGDLRRDGILRVAHRFERALKQCVQFPAELVRAALDDLADLGRGKKVEEKR